MIPRLSDPAPVTGSPPGPASTCLGVEQLRDLEHLRVIFLSRRFRLSVGVAGAIAVAAFRDGVRR